MEKNAFSSLFVDDFFGFLLVSKAGTNKLTNFLQQAIQFDSLKEYLEFEIDRLPYSIVQLASVFPTCDSASSDTADAAVKHAISDIEKKMLSQPLLHRFTLTWLLFAYNCSVEQLLASVHAPYASCFTFTDTDVSYLVDNQDRFLSLLRVIQYPPSISLEADLQNPNSIIFGFLNAYQSNESSVTDYLIHNSDAEVVPVSSIEDVIQQSTPTAIIQAPISPLLQLTSLHTNIPCRGLIVTNLSTPSSTPNDTTSLLIRNVAKVVLYQVRELFGKRGFHAASLSDNILNSSKFIIRHAELNDIQDLVALEQVSWPEGLRISETEIHHRISNPNVCTTVAVVGNELAGVLYTQIIDSAESLYGADFETASKLCTSGGKVVQLLSINVHPRFSQHSISEALRNLALERAMASLRIESVVAVTRCRNFNPSRGTINEYLEARLPGSDVHVDPILQFHLSGGATILGLVPNYRPLDIENQGNGILVHYNLNQLKPCFESVSNISPDIFSTASHLLKLAQHVVPDCAIDMKSPLLEQGFNSANLIQFRGLISRDFNISLDSTIFFRHSTLDSLSSYVSMTLNARSIDGHAGTQLGSSFDRNSIPQISESSTTTSRAKSNLPHFSSPSGIAIVGMACRTPGALNLEEFEVLLRNGQSGQAITGVTRPTHNPIAERHSFGLLNDIDKFDNRFFRITEKEAIQIDPQHRILLELHQEALEHAGIPPSSLKGSDTGVFVGISRYIPPLPRFVLSGSHDYEALSGDEVAPQFGIGTSAAAAAGRVAYFYDLRGPTMSVDTACSSSAVSVHLACNSILSGEAKMALVSGVNLILTSKTSSAFLQSNMLSASGACKTFDEQADGYVRSEAAAVIVLKPLEAAIRDNDNIHAVILGTAINQDGTSNGITAPSLESQVKCYQASLRNANVEHSSVSYIEAHGTGTTLGDEVEMTSLSQAYQSRGNDNILRIGSVKTNIGHTEAAAGLMGLIKVALSLSNGVIYPHLHFHRATSTIERYLSCIPCEIPLKLTEWRHKNRRAAVSSFGFTGTNAHIIVEQGFQPSLATSRSSSHLVTISAQSPNSAAGMKLELSSFLQKHPGTQISDISFTSTIKRDHFSHRYSFVASSTQELLELLSTKDLPSKASNKTVAFIFTGQGSQYLHMGEALYKTYSVFKDVVDKCETILSRYSDNNTRFTDYVFNACGGDEIEAARQLNNTKLSQPGIFVIEYALACLWKSLGIVPKFVLGHSIGEIVAATVAGILELEDALRLIVSRSDLMQSLPTEAGGMLAVLCSHETIQPLIAEFKRNSPDVILDIAAVNSPSQVVVSGALPAIKDFKTLLSSSSIKAIQLSVSHAFHSRMMEPMLNEFDRVLQETTFHEPKNMMFLPSSEAATHSSFTSPRYWRQQISQGVLFQRAVEKLFDHNVDIVIEIGPKSILSALVRANPFYDEKVLLLSSIRPDEASAFINTVSELYSAGIDIDFSGLEITGNFIPSYPTYSFERKSFWLRNRDLWVVQALSSSVDFPFASNIPNLEEYENSIAKLNLTAGMAMLGAIKELLGDRIVSDSFLFSDLLAAVQPKFHPLMYSLLSDLASERYITSENEGRWRMHFAKTPQDWNPAVVGTEAELLFACKQNLSKVFTGVESPLESLFGLASSGKPRSQMYYEFNPIAHYYNDLVSTCIEIILKNCHSDYKIKILEIGAGTGGTTSSILPIVRDRCARYVFTDISKSFLTAAERKFSREYPFMEYKLLDISKPTKEQEFNGQEFDIIIGANVIHATPNLSQSINGMRQLLRPGGSVILLELTRHHMWLSLTFGLTDGWWSFMDERKGGPLLSRARWTEKFLEEGFAAVHIGPEHPSAERAVIVAQSPDLHPLSKLGTGLSEFYTTRRVYTLRDSDLLQSLPEFGISVAPLGSSIDRGSIVILDGEAERILSIISLYPEICAEAGILVLNTPYKQSLHNLAIDVSKYLLLDISDVELARHTELLLLEIFKAISKRTFVRYRGEQRFTIIDSTEVTNPQKEYLIDATGHYVDTFSVPSVDFVREHEIYSKPVFPAASYLSLMLDAVRSTKSEPILRINDFSILAPLVVDSPKLMQRVVETNGSIRLFVQSAHLNWEEFAFATAGEYVPSALPSIPLAGLVETNIKSFYEQLLTSGILYGPRFQVIQKLSISPGMCVAEIRNEYHNDKRFAFPHATIDAGLQILSYSLNSSVAAVPVEIGEVDFYQVPCPMNVIIRITWKKLDVSSVVGDILYTTTSNTPVLHLRGVILRTAPQSILFTRTPARSKDQVSSFSIQWCEAPLPDGGITVPQLDWVALVDMDSKFISAFSVLAKKIINLPAFEDVDMNFERHFPGDRSKGVIIIANVHCRSLLALAQSVINMMNPPPIFVLSAQAHMIQSGHNFNPIQSLINGFCRTLALEPGLLVRQIDLDEFSIRNMSLAIQEIGLFGEIAEHSISYRGGVRYAPRVVNASETTIDEAKLKCDMKGSYIITGGYGGLGLLICEWLLSHGAGHVILVGRNSPSTDVESKLSTMRSTFGDRVHSRVGDVSELDSLRVLFDDVEKTLPPIRGIVHSAGTVEDAALPNMTWDKFEQVLKSKYLGTNNLAKLIKERELDLSFFVLFSSVMSVFGSLGQSNHTAVCGYQDAYAAHLRVQGIPCTSINWGNWSDVGRAADLVEYHSKRRGLDALNVKEGIKCWETALCLDIPQVCFCKPNWSRVNFPTSMALYFSLVSSHRALPEPSVASSSRAPEIGVVNSQVSLEENIAQLVANIIGSEVVDVDDGFFDLGLDSLMTMELKGKLQALVGSTLRLPPTLLFDYPSISKLSTYLHSLLVTSESRPTPPLVNTSTQKLSSESGDVAVVGMSCRFPGGASSPEEFWKLMIDEVDALEDIPVDRWKWEDYYDEDRTGSGKMYVRQAGFLKEPISEFDANFFSISAREAEMMDPQQRLLLEVAWEALEKYGIQTTPGANCGVYVGVMTSDFSDLIKAKLRVSRNFQSHFEVGNNHSAFAGRLSYFLDFSGPCMTVETACSSSLVSLHYACMSLLSGECEMALAGGVNIILDPDYMVNLCAAKMLSPTGRCHTFDSSADGYARGEGCGVVVLKRLADAERDGDRILAVIRGSAINQDGASGGLTVPNGPAQVKVVESALQRARVHPADVQYIEAHGTGTALGDPIEVNSLRQSYGSTPQRTRTDPLVLGTAKVNIGHTEAAAGMAGLIKVILQIQHGCIPRHLNFKELNSLIDLDAIPAVIPATGPLSWPTRSDGRPRIAGVSSFGFSGTNCHVIVSEYLNNQISEFPPEVSGNDSHLVTISAKTQQALDTSLSSFLKEMELQVGKISIANVSYTTTMRRSHFKYRAAFVTPSIQDLIDQLRRRISSPSSSRVMTNSRKRVIFVFSSKNTDLINTESSLYVEQPPFRNAIDECARVLGISSQSLLNGDLAAFAIQYALVALWRSLGITPDDGFGHGILSLLPAVIFGRQSLTDVILSLSPSDSDPEDSEFFDISGNPVIVNILSASKCTSENSVVFDVGHFSTIPIIPRHSNPFKRAMAQFYEEGLPIHFPKLSGTVLNLPIHPMSRVVHWPLEHLDPSQSETKAYSYSWQPVTQLSAATQNGSLEYCVIGEDPISIPLGTKPIVLKLSGNHSKILAELQQRLYRGTQLLVIFNFVSLDTPSDIERSVFIFLQLLKACKDSCPHIVLATINALAGGNIASAPLCGIVNTWIAENPDFPLSHVDFESMDEFISGIRGHLVQIVPCRVFRVVSGILCQRVLSEVAPDPVSIVFRGTVVVTGGLGALGKQLICWLVNHGAQCVAIISRSAARADFDSFVSTLPDSVTILNLKADVTSFESLHSCFADLSKTSPPITSIFHLAAAQEDGFASDLTQESLHTAFAPKAIGAFNLHLIESALNLNLDHFVLFSSTAAIFGHLKASNYSASNSFIDALVHHRRLKGLSATSINWGLWGGSGMGQKTSGYLESVGIKGISPSRALLLMGHCLRLKLPHIMIARIDWTTLSTVNKFVRENISHYSKPSKSSLSPKLVPQESFSAEFIKELVENTVSEVFHVDNVFKLDRRAGLFQQGLDSVMALEIYGKLQASLGSSVTLPATLVIDHPSIDQLVQEVTRLALSSRSTSAPSSSVQASADSLIAVVGMSCRFAGGANSPEDYWNLMLNETDALVDIPGDRWNWEDYYAKGSDIPGKMYVKQAGFLNTPISQFDAAFFGVSPIEAEMMDPQQRILLEVAWEALETAGFVKNTIKNVGVYCGTTGHEFETLVAKQINHQIGKRSYFGSGLSTAVQAGRLSYIFGFEGPSITVDTACSSALVAVHSACSSLLTGECEMALAGAVNVILDPDYMANLCAAKMLSPGGRCRTFDASADGYARGEGCGVVVLKRLADAERDGDRILAVIRGSAVNQDGASGGLTVPNGPAQVKVVESALRRAGVSATDVQYVEAHGTGTSLGDPIEVNSLRQSYGSTNKRTRTEPLIIGTAKVNIGHTEAAAGMAGLIKVILQMQHECIPRHLNFQELNKMIDLDAIPAVLTNEGAVRWPRRSDGRLRMAGVSSFGFSGTNCHVIVSEYRPNSLKSTQLERLNAPPPEPQLVSISAKSEKSLRRLLAAYIELLDCQKDSVTLNDVSYTTLMRRTQFKYRNMFVVESVQELIDQMRDKLSTAESSAIHGLLFIFSGEKDAYREAANRFVEDHDVFREAMEEIALLLDINLKNLFESKFFIFAIEYALYRLWSSWGMCPQYVVGSFPSSVDELNSGNVSDYLEILLPNPPRGSFTKFTFISGEIQYTPKGVLVNLPTYAWDDTTFWPAFKTATSTTQMNHASPSPSQSEDSSISSLGENLPLLDVIALQYIQEFAQGAGVPFTVGTIYAVDDFIIQAKLLTKYRRLVQAIFNHLTRLGFAAWIREDVDIKILHLIPLKFVTDSSPEAELLCECGKNLLAVLRGTQPPLEHLFRMGSRNMPLARAVYSESAVSKSYNSLVAEQVEKLLHNFSHDETIRLLEIGAGTGGTTLSILPLLRGRKVTYTFTDVSQQFLTVASKTFGRDYNFLQYNLLDISKSPKEQGFSDSYDVIIAANVIHATPELSVTLSNVKSLLGPRGAFVLHEVTTANIWVDLTFGLTDGWWLYTDSRKHGPLLSVSKWQQLASSINMSTMHFAAPDLGVPDRHVFVMKPQLPASSTLPRSSSSSGGLSQTKVLANFRGFLQVDGSNVNHVVSSNMLKRFPMLKDHKVFGKIYFPASGYIELALNIGAPLKLTCVQGLEIFSPLILADDTEVHVNLEQNKRVTITSTSTAATEPILHASLTLSSTLLQQPLAVPQIGSSQSIEYNPELLYTSYKKIGFEYGVNFQAVQSAIRYDSVVKGKVSTDFSASKFIMHPGFLDSCFQVLGITFVSGEHPMLPICVGCFNLIEPLENTRYYDVVATWRMQNQLIRGDIDILNNQGDLVATIRDLCATTPKNSVTTNVSTENILYEVQWKRILESRDFLKSALSRRVMVISTSDFSHRLKPIIPSNWTHHSFEKITAKVLGGLKANDLVIFVPDTTSTSSIELVDASKDIALDLLHLCQSALSRDFPEIVVVTQNALKVLPTDSNINLSHSLLNGFCRTLALEPELIVRQIDVDSIDSTNLAMLVEDLVNTDSVDHQMAYRDGVRHVPRLAVVAEPPLSSTDILVDSNGSYFITGGLGGLGLVICEWLLTHRAGHVVLMGRHPPNADITAKLTSFKRIYGEKVHYYQGDVSNKSSLVEIFDAIARTLPPIVGIIHSAGYVEDCSLAEFTQEKFLRVCAAKVDGSWNLWNLVRERKLKLSLFALYSSAASIVGSLGQLNHSSACSFQDSFVHFMNQQGIPSICINWGNWTEIGRASQLSTYHAAKGLPGISNALGIKAWELAWVNRWSQITVVKIDWNIFQKGSRLSNTFYSSILPRSNNSNSLSQDPPSSPSSPDRLKHVSTSRNSSPRVLNHSVSRIGSPRIPSRSTTLSRSLSQSSSVTLTRHKEGFLNCVTKITEICNDVLGYSGSSSLGEHDRFFDCGLDSLTSMEVKGRVQKLIGATPRLPHTVLFDYPTISKLSTYIVSDLGLGHLFLEEDPAPPISELSTIFENPPTIVTPENSSVLDDFVAVIGMSCRFPGGANSPKDFWNLMMAEIDPVGDVPSERWRWEDYYDENMNAPGKVYVHQAGFLNVPIDQFDASFFGITPREAEMIDPQQRLLLEVSWEALENAGVPPLKLSGTETGVFVGAMSHEYLDRIKDTDLASVSNLAYIGSGNSQSALSGRLSYFLGLQGPSLTIDTACSSSLVALHLASQSLLNGETNLSIVAGVNVMLDPEMNVFLCAAKMLSPGGRCRTFDASADGYARGEGCGVVVLKRLADAERDGDRILAVIRGSAVNQDGASGGLTVPNGPAQVKVVESALRRAGVAATDVQYVEAHGTGTSLGDPIEVNSLRQSYGSTNKRTRTEPLIIGTAKVNIGHTEAAAGMAGLIKVILQMQHECIPRHLNFQELNKMIDLDAIPAVLTNEGAVRWPRRSDGRLRMAGVSSFGFSGTNCHVIVSEYRYPPAPSPVRDRPTHSPPFNLIALSAKTENALYDLLKNYVESLEHQKEQISLSEIAYVTNTRRSHFKSRASFVVSSVRELLDEMNAFVERGLVDKPKDSRGLSKIAFAFTGQGSQYLHMGQRLYEEYDVFRDAVDNCAEILALDMEDSTSIIDLMFNVAGDDMTASARLNETKYAQPAIFTIEYAMYCLWKSWGVVPDYVTGHSIGEIVAATVSGVIELKDALRLIAFRSSLMGSLPRGIGGMLAVKSSYDTVLPLVEDFKRHFKTRCVIDIAAVNSATQVVLSGELTALSEIKKLFDAHKIQSVSLNVSHAFHSSMMEPILNEFEEILHEITFSDATEMIFIPSSAASSRYAFNTPAYWKSQIIDSVLFQQSIEGLIRQGIEVVVEVGPKPILTSLIRSFAPSLTILPSMTSDQPITPLQSLATLFNLGADIEVPASISQRLVDLPTYPFQRKTYFVPGLREFRKTSGSNLSRYTIAKHLLDDWIRIELAIMFAERNITIDSIPNLHHRKLYSKLLNVIKLHDLHLLKLTSRAFERRNELKSRVSSYPEVKWEFGLAEKCITALPQILQNQQEPLEILFAPAPDGRSFAEHYYLECTPSLQINSLIHEKIKNHVQKRPSASISVLEVGGGTGSTTVQVLRALGNKCKRYVFTDLSRAFLSGARAKFAEYPFMEFRTLDVCSQKMDLGETFDIIIAANVIHATPDLHQSLSNLRNHLSKNGSFFLLELTSTSLFLDITFGLTPGWWNSEDKLRSEGSPLLSESNWESLLNDSNFNEVETFSSWECDLAIFRAYFKETISSFSVPRISADIVVENLSILEDIRSAFLTVTGFQRNEISDDADIFESGMDSLMAVQFQALLNQIPGVHGQVNQPFLRQNPTLSALAHGLKSSSRSSFERPVIVDATSAERIEDIPLFFFHDGAGNVSQYHTLLSSIGYNKPVFLVQHPYPSNPTKVKSLEQLAELYLNEMIAHCRFSRAILAGWSLGGNLALEVASLMEKRNIKIDNILLIDTFSCDALPASCKLSPAAIDLREMLEWTLQALKSHKTKPYSGRVMLLKASSFGSSLWQNVDSWRSGIESDPYSGFEELLSHLEIRFLPSACTHLQLFTPLQLPLLLPLFKRALEDPPSVCFAFPGLHRDEQNYLNAYYAQDTKLIEVLIARGNINEKVKQFEVTRK